MSAPNKRSWVPASRAVATERPRISVNKWDLVRIAIVVLGTQGVIRLMILMRQLCY